jgi:hypothetical protein
MKLIIEENDDYLVPTIIDKQIALSFINFNNETLGFLYDGYSRQILINHNDEELYKLFLKLYNDIEDCTFLFNIQYEVMLKHSKYYKEIYDGKSITWKNKSNISKDEYFIITNEEEGIRIKFISTKERDIKFLPMKIMDVSDKNPFDIPFCNLYNSLCKLALKRTEEEQEYHDMKSTL